MISPWFLSLVPLLPASVSEPFRALGIDGAIAVARTEKKSVLLAFVDERVPDSRKLDTTTWIESKVREWIARKAVAIRIEADRHADLAERFRVHEWPTIVFLGEQGTELDRITGYVDGRAFRLEADSILNGTDAVERVKRRLAGREKDPRVRVDLARVLSDRASFSDALREYVWCWEHGTENDPTFEPVRLGFLLRELRRLARIYPPAADEMAARASALFTHVTDCTGTIKELDDFVAIQEMLERPDRILEAFDALEPADEDCGPLRERLRAHVIPPLVDARRYEDASKLLGDVLADLASRIESLTAERKRLERERGDAAAPAVDAAQRSFRLEAARRYETLVGSRRYDEAEAFATRALAFDPRGAFYVLLIQGAVRAEAHGSARSIVSRAYGDAQLSEGERLEVKLAARHIVRPK